MRDYRKGERKGSEHVNPCLSSPIIELKSHKWKHPKKKRAGDCERALFSPCSHLSSVMVQNSHTCEGDMMKENNIRTSEANRKTS